MRRLFFLPVISLLASCAGGNNVPSDIIPTNKMETIIWQLVQSDQYINTVLAKDSTKKSRTERMKIYQDVFDLNKTTLAEYKKSYAYYMNHPDISKIMFDSVSAIASRQGADLRTEMFKPKVEAPGTHGTRR